MSHAIACPDITPTGCAMREVPPEWHDNQLYFAELRLHAAYGLTDWLAIDLLWSLRIIVERFALRDLATMQPIAPPFGVEIHHRNEVLVGPSDPWLGLRAAERLGPWTFAFRGGVTLPVGATVENPFALTREGMVHEHLQLGTGTVDPFLEAEVRRKLAHLTISASLLGKTSVYQNSHGYQAGPFLIGGVHATSDLWTTRWAFTVGAAVYHEWAERWAGVQEDEGNLGRTDLLLDTAIAWRLPRALSLALSARVPVYTVANGEQVSTPAIVELSVARPFDL